MIYYLNLIEKNCCDLLHLGSNLVNYHGINPSKLF